MQYRPLGRSGLKISPICLGTMMFGGPTDEATSTRIVAKAREAGINFIDTADVYAGGVSEQITGQALKNLKIPRENVVIATKVGSDMGQGKVDLSPAYIRKAVEDSLRRLQVDCIDLYQSHRDDEATPQEETLEAYAQLIKAGKVRAIGASNFTAQRLAQALEISRRHGLPRYESLQPLYNLCDRAEFEQELRQLCLDQDVGVINFYTLAAGFLTGKYRTAADAAKSPRGKTTVGKYLNPRGLRILAALDEVAASTGSTPARVAVAWVMAQPGITSPIASATSLDQLAELTAAAQLVLDAKALALLAKASAPD